MPTDAPAGAATLLAAILARGLDVTVQVDGALAIVQSHDPHWFPDAELRTELVRAARAAGFTNVAVELRPSPRDAEAFA